MNKKSHIFKSPQFLLLLLTSFMMFSVPTNDVNARTSNKETIATLKKEVEEKESFIKKLEKKIKSLEKSESKYEKIDAARKSIYTAEKKTTRENFETAKKLVDKLDDEDEEFNERLANIQKIVEENEYNEAAKVVEATAKNLTAESLATAEKAVENLHKKDDKLTKKVAELKNELKQKEEAKEQEKKQAAEREAQQKKEAAAAAATPAPAPRQETVIQEQAPAPEVTQAVFIAPQSGTKYHSTSGCRGLNRANSISQVSINEVGGRTPCAICY